MASSSTGATLMCWSPGRAWPWQTYSARKAKTTSISLAEANPVLLERAPSLRAYHAPADAQKRQTPLDGIVEGVRHLRNQIRKQSSYVRRRRADGIGRGPHHNGSFLFHLLGVDPGSAVGGVGEIDGWASRR